MKNSALRALPAGAPAIALVALGPALGLLASCAQPRPAPPPLTPTQHAGLRNVFRAAPGVYSGSQPEGQPGFDSLKHMGIRTILSVDGGTPDVDLARGMKYVHVPVKYSGIDADEARAIAAAIRDLPGPIYVHCHHGLHRGPTAVSLALVMLGRMTPEQGERFQRLAGTAESYEGLYACVRESEPVAPSSLDALADKLPESSRPIGPQAAMVAIDEAYSNLKDCDKNAWKAPPDHPDLSPLAEASRLADLFRDFSKRSDTEPAEYVSLARQAAARADALEKSVAMSSPERTAKLKDLGATCKACHAAYRD